MAISRELQAEIDNICSVNGYHSTMFCKQHAGKTFLFGIPKPDDPNWKYQNQRMTNIFVWEQKDGMQSLMVWVELEEPPAWVRGEPEFADYPWPSLIQEDGFSEEEIESALEIIEGR